MGPQQPSSAADGHGKPQASYQGTCGVRHAHLLVPILGWPVHRVAMWVHVDSAAQCHWFSRQELAMRESEPRTQNMNPTYVISRLKLPAMLGLCLDKVDSCLFASKISLEWLQPWKGPWSDFLVPGPWAYRVPQFGSPAPQLRHEVGRPLNEALGAGQSSTSKYHVAFKNQTSFDLHSPGLVYFDVFCTCHIDVRISIYT